MKKYTIDYFIKKFKATRAKDWTTGVLEDRGAMCVLGHCGIKKGEYWKNDESVALHKILLPGAAYDSCHLFDINDQVQDPRSTFIKRLQRAKVKATTCKD